MDRDEALGLLKEGRIEEWNQRRSSAEEIPPLEKADLSGANLSGANLRGANLREANLREANLREANLREANLREADLRGANLAGADLREADLRGANLHGIPAPPPHHPHDWLKLSNLYRADLRGADLRGVDLSEATLSEADLRGANLSGANLRGVDLSDANLSGADLSGADLSGADLSGADLSGADLSGADLTGARSRSRPSRPSLSDPLSPYMAPLPSGPLPSGPLFPEPLPPEPLPPEPLPPALDKRPTQRLKGLVRRVSLLIGRLISLDWRVADPVDCTVFAPPSVAQGDWLSVQVFAHRPDQAEEARGLAQEIDQQARKRGFKSLEMGIKRGTSLTFHLCVPGIEFNTSMESLVWEGRPSYVHFAARTPPRLPIGTVIGRATVVLDRIPIASILFRLEVVEKSEPPTAPSALMSDSSATHRSSLLPVGDRIRRYKKAFISYASKDRPEVLKRVQMLRLARIRYFQDVLKLEPGDRWKRKLYLHIDRSDLFLLFWSTNAKQSQWVLEEVRYAIKRKGGNDLAPPDLIPVIIEGPPVPEPPVELAHLHFNDYLVYFMVPPEATHQEEKP